MLKEKNTEQNENLHKVSNLLCSVVQLGIKRVQNVTKLVILSESEKYVFFPMSKRGIKYHYESRALSCASLSI